MVDHDLAQDLPAFGPAAEEEAQGLRRPPLIPHVLPNPPAPSFVHAFPAPDPLPSAGAFDAQAPVRETTGPIRRALALAIRATLPALLITGLLLAAALVAGIEEAGAALILLVGAGLVGAFWLHVERQERRDSAAGLEHHRIEVARTLAAAAEANRQQLRRAILAEHFQRLGVPPEHRHDR
jgi:hypothetical protein